MPERYIEKILKARVYDVAVETPLEHAPVLSTRLDNEVYLKREDLQPVFSFKLRGAYNKMAQLPGAARAKGVIAASAGNHAQGVALAAGRLGIYALIVMPTTTPDIKVKSVISLGAEAVLFGDTYDEAYKHALELAEQRGLTFIHPYDDPEVIAGQGTIAMELLHQHTGPLDAIFVPVGGGGLIAGISAYVKYLYPDVKVIGVEPDDAPSMHNALLQGERIRLDKVGIFADGVAVRQVGQEPFRIARDCVDEVVLVSSDEICAGIKDIFDETRSIVEPAGALAVAGLKKYVERNDLHGRHLIAINSGANVNFDRLRYVAEHSELGEHREALLAVTIAEQPGSFLAFCRLIGERSITEFNYRFAQSDRAHVFAGVQLRGGEQEKNTLIELLRDHDYPVVDMTGNEMAKSHVRYMVGGRSPDVDHEVIYRFQFPERPGALLRFLSSMGARWNISMFHYRNLGSAYGQVLVGMQVPTAEHGELQRFLDELGYVYWEERENPAYDLFLGRG